MLSEIHNIMLFRHNSKFNVKTSVYMAKYLKGKYKIKKNTVMYHYERMKYMYIQVRQQSDHITAYLSGELDHHTADQVKAELDGIIKKFKNTNLVLDLKNLSFMDSSGLGVLLGRYKKLKGYGNSLYIKNANRQVEKVFNVSGIYRIIKKIK
ncbi:MAG: STAS domain-containing protein [Christensenellales bacterium]|jgi:stage II sporulation protein AA (anti-sigma F factor antagonist)